MLDRKMFEIVRKTLGEKYIFFYPADFYRRVIVQKSLYLLSHGNTNPKIKLPYKWSFYIRGPYSSEIAHQFYYLKEFNKDILNETYELSQQNNRAINHFLNFKKKIEELSEENRIYENEFEILASIVYIGLQLGNDYDRIIKKLYDHKPEKEEDFPKGILLKYCKIIVDFGYI